MKIVGSRPESGILPPYLQQQRSLLRLIMIQSMKLGQRLLEATEIGEVGQLGIDLHDESHWFSTGVRNFAAKLAAAT